MTPSDIEHFMSFTKLTLKNTKNKYTQKELDEINRKITEAVIAENPTDVATIPLIERNRKKILKEWGEKKEIKKLHNPV